MASGETILKFTDYPFAYSFVGIILGGLGFQFSQNSVLFLGIAGAIGTLFTLTDPIGRIVRSRAKTRIDRKYSNQEKKNEPTPVDFMKSSIQSRSIVIEVDKMVGLWYFFITTVIFLVVVGLSPELADKLSDNIPSYINCDVFCFKVISVLASTGILVIIGIIATVFWRELDEKIEIAGNHQQAVSNDFATENSVDNMSRAVESGDWETAKLWWKKIRDEINNKKGKRELIIKAADLVYSPLHKEADDFENKRLFIPTTKRYPTFEHSEWDKIKQFSYQSIIDDTDLRHRVDSFYKMMDDYNQQLGNVSRTIVSIISKHASEAFGRSVSTIRYDIEGKHGSGEVDMIGCALFREHPIEFYGENGKVRHIEIVRSNGNVHRTSEKSEYEKFDSVWNKIVDDVQMNNDVKQLQHWYSMLKAENQKLMKIYSEKIEMQWKV